MVIKKIINILNLICKIKIYLKYKLNILKYLKISKWKNQTLVLYYIIFLKIWMIQKFLMHFCK